MEKKTRRTSTPAEETSTNRLSASPSLFAASTRLRVPTSSVCFGPLSPCQRLEGNAVVPVQHATAATLPLSLPSKENAAARLRGSRASASTSSSPSGSLAAGPPKTRQAEFLLRVMARTR
jgi:hypothetical protein